jgi:hypothetical protein
LAEESGNVGGWGERLTLFATDFLFIVEDAREYDFTVCIARV